MKNLGMIKLCLILLIEHLENENFLRKEDYIAKVINVSICTNFIYYLSQWLLDHWMEKIIPYLKKRLKNNTWSWSTISLCDSSIYVSSNYTCHDTVLYLHEDLRTRSDIYFITLELKVTCEILIMVC